MKSMNINKYYIYVTFLYYLFIYITLCLQFQILVVMPVLPRTVVASMYCGNHFGVPIQFKLHYTLLYL